MEKEVKKYLRETDSRVKVLQKSLNQALERNQALTSLLDSYRKKIKTLEGELSIFMGLCEAYGLHKSQIVKVGKKRRITLGG